MANRQCNLCGGDHTEIKCPSLDRWMQHLVNVINKQNNTNYNVDLLFEMLDVHRIWSQFCHSASKPDMLGKAQYDWWNMVRCYRKRLNYKLAGEKRKGKRRKKAIRCGYCNASGHTRRTCKKMKADRAVLVADTTLRRSMFLDKCRELGLGVGSLLKFKLNEDGLQYKNKGYPSFQDDTIIAMITEIPVQSITAFSEARRYSNFYERAYFICKAVTGHKSKDGENINLSVNNSVFNGAFLSIVEDTSVPHYNAFWDVEVVSKSSDMSWNTDEGDRYLEWLKKQQRKSLETYVKRSERWTKFNQ